MRSLDVAPIPSPLLTRCPMDLTLTFSEHMDYPCSVNKCHCVTALGGSVFTTEWEQDKELLEESTEHWIYIDWLLGWFTWEWMNGLWKSFFKSGSCLLYFLLGVSAISQCFILVEINASTLSLMFSKRFGKSFHVEAHEIEVWLLCSSDSAVLYLDDRWPGLCVLVCAQLCVAVIKVSQMDSSFKFFVS